MQGGYGKNNYRQNYGNDAGMYAGADPSKGLYGPMNTGNGVNYDAKSMYDGYGSKSCYNGYDGVNRGGGMGGSSLRRSRSIHESAVVGGTPSQQQRGLAAAAAAAQRRRNPYDYLPDEPAMTSLGSTTAAVTSLAVPGGVTNKPDIMQSVDGRLDSSADTGRGMMNRWVSIFNFGE